MSNDHSKSTRLRRRCLLMGGVAAAVAAAAAVPVSRWLRRESQAESLGVGGRAVTCNLTLANACTPRQLDTKSGESSDVPFEYRKYSVWPEIEESLMAWQIQAGYMLAPLVMDVTSKKIPVNIVSLGHGSGAVI